ncbi:hypothetical protein N789_11770 [Arenimonas oryziterrae DSM 21050 = YC6267]|uniref:Uncharacterized protein n=2 Tax=Arenimonas TaxID=490567 RepID=A0A091ATY5_9GAMM|nr:hypothetical protein N789_11770 [Arenimonas oryziterrae DSM 21050 = YC6267]
MKQSVGAHPVPGGCAESLDAEFLSRVSSLERARAQFDQPYLIYLAVGGGYLRVDAYFIGKLEDGRAVIVSAESGQVVDIDRQDYEGNIVDAKVTASVWRTPQDGSSHDECRFIVVGSGGRTVSEALLPLNEEDGLLDASEDELNAQVMDLLDKYSIE